MKTINKIFSGIRKIVAFPITSVGIIIILTGIIITANGILIFGKLAKENLNIEIREFHDEIEKAMKKEK